MAEESARPAAAGKPEALPVRFSSIPDELKKLHQWVVWDYVAEEDRDKGTLHWKKPPLQADTKQPARSNDPRTWRPFKTALDAYQGGGLAGIGFVLNNSTADLVGIDLDNCRDPLTGDVAEWALRIVKLVNSYTEASPSGRGLRIFIRADFPRGARRKGDVEVYSRRQYVTVTGHHREDTPPRIEPRQAEFDRLYQEHFPESGGTDAGDGAGRSSANGRTPVPGELTDEEIIRRASAAKNGAKFRKLWAGDYSDKDSQSEADLGLLNILAFWTRKDAERMDQLFRQSGLFRQKWDREGYAERTIRKAIEDTTHIHGSRMPTMSTGGGLRVFPGDSVAPPAKADRPVIVITPEEGEVNDQAIAALANADNLYQRAGRLVMVTHKGRRDGRSEPVARAPRIVRVPPPKLRDVLARVACWQRKSRSPEEEEEPVQVHPPPWCVAAVDGFGEWPGIRELRAVVEAPVMRSDGTVLQTPGYDPPTTLLFAPNADFPPVPEAPTRDDAVRCALLLLDLIEDFPLKGQADRVAWLAALLTPFARFAIPGPCPLFLMDANTPGAGKGKLCDLIALIATGRMMDRTTWPGNEDEHRKRITSIALAGKLFTLLDNLNGPLGGAALDSALTAESWDDRLLGISEMTPGIRLDTIWFATGNNVRLRGDMRRRVLPCRLESDRECPEDRDDFRRPDLFNDVRQERTGLAVAALTILRAYHAAGRAAVRLPPFGSYEAWSAAVRAPIFWATGLDPYDSRAGLWSADPDRDAAFALVAGLGELPGARDPGLTAAAISKLLEESRECYGTLREALAVLTKDNKPASAGTIGKHLGKMQERRVEGQWVEQVKRRGHVVLWRVCGSTDAAADGPDA